MAIESASPASVDGLVFSTLDGHQSLDLDQDDGGAPQNRPSKGAAVAVACIVGLSLGDCCHGLTVARPVVPDISSVMVERGVRVVCRMGLNVSMSRVEEAGEAQEDKHAALWLDLMQRPKVSWEALFLAEYHHGNSANSAFRKGGLPQSQLPLDGCNVPLNLDQFLPSRSGELVSPSDVSYMVNSGASSHATTQDMADKPPSPPVTDTRDSGLFAAYYEFFHPAHPFLLPKPQMLELLSSGRFPHLSLAIQYIGSLYMPPSRRRTQEDELGSTLADADISRDGILVQAMLLYSIGLHMCDREEQSAQVMHATVSLALELGMDKRDFAIQNGSNSAIMEESFRRTWWEVFVLDGLNAGVNPKYNLMLLGHESSIDLPCEECDYAIGRMSPILKNLNDFDDDIFVDQEFTFSSSAYRIDAIRLLHKVFMAGCGQGSDSHLLESADVHLKNWTLHLPVEKRNPIDKTGYMDEVLFEAHMIVSACTIMLHRPRSDLNLEDVERVRTCVAAHGSSPLPGGLKDVHTVKAMQAAKDICGLVLLPCPMVKHTPFFSCAVTMSSVVFLSYWSFIAIESGDTFIKDNIRLNIGVLKTLGELWPIANTVLGQVKGVAQELFQSRKALNSDFSHAQVTRQEIFQGMIESVTLPGGDDDLYERFLALPQIS
ncbi:hypothetical protein FKW77_003615 [Venturia effusa]|uniref:Xylanolytic transcriptional activator regulatory domain-containing protein n=1 Tax=Venturia effusa TaxID=50376 RepID=A0A517L532_9PEZI|nr:hypothetical protein FKW77_003615 [Venturia effusa]